MDLHIGPAPESALALERCDFVSEDEEEEEEEDAWLNSLLFPAVSDCNKKATLCSTAFSNVFSNDGSLAAFANTNVQPMNCEILASVLAVLFALAEFEATAPQN